MVEGVGRASVVVSSYKRDYNRKGFSQVEPTPQPPERMRNENNK